MKILTWPDDRLEQECTPIKEFGTDLLRQEVKFMQDTLAQHSNGLALAANQVAISKRIIVIKPNKFGIDDIVINPKILTYSEDMTNEIEGCLSFPKMNAVIPRHKVIELQYNNVKGNKLVYTCRDLLARVIQHELDHLNGVLFTYYLPTKLRRTIETKMQRKRIRTNGRRTKNIK